MLYKGNPKVGMESYYMVAKLVSLLGSSTKFWNKKDKDRHGLTISSLKLLLHMK